jgi:hypothetical protein
MLRVAAPADQPPPDPDRIRKEWIAEALRIGGEEAAKHTAANSKELQEAAEKKGYRLGHSDAMAKAWRYLVGGAAAGFAAAVAVYGIASVQGGYLARMGDQNAEIAGRIHSER